MVQQMLSSRNEERRKHKGYGILERENITEVGQIQLDKPIALSNDSISFPLSSTNYPKREIRDRGRERSRIREKKEGWQRRAALIPRKKFRDRSRRIDVNF